jgi:hypothetical protein
MTPAIEVRDLQKTFGNKHAVQGIDLSVEEGSVLGLLGANGAGKSTIVRMLATLLPPDSGVAKIVGYDIRTDAQQVRRCIGLTGQYAAIDDKLTGRENLRLVGSLQQLGRKNARLRADEFLERFGLAEAADQQSGTYSGGMRRRLDLAVSLIGTPQVLFLDEPTTGLDPTSRVALWDMIAEEVAAGLTVLLTTQYLEEADRLADSIAVIDDGRLVANGTSASLKAHLGSAQLALTVQRPADRKTVEDTFSLHGHRTRHCDDTTVLVNIDKEDLRHLLGVAASLPVVLESVDLRSPTLDDVFIALTKPNASPLHGGFPNFDKHAERIVTCPPSPRP